MTIDVKRVADCVVIFIDGKESEEAFKALVQRATDKWPDAPAEVKEFADQITNHDWMEDSNSMNKTGKGLQDYSKQIV